LISVFSDQSIRNYAPAATFATAIARPTFSKTRLNITETPVMGSFANTTTLVPSWKAVFRSSLISQLHTSITARNALLVLSGLVTTFVLVLSIRGDSAISSTPAVGSTRLGHMPGPLGQMIARLQQATGSFGNSTRGQQAGGPGGLGATVFGADAGSVAATEYGRQSSASVSDASTDADTDSENVDYHVTDDDNDDDVASNANSNSTTSSDRIFMVYRPEDGSFSPHVATPGVTTPEERARFAPY
jgi:hypothetical protein